MLTDPSLDIQGAIVEAVKASTTAAVAGRVYDAVPTAPTFPYVTVGDGQVLPELGEQTDAADTTTQIDVWSRAVGYAEAKGIAKSIISALHDAALSVPHNKGVSILFQSANYLRDPDGLTRHAALTFQIQTDAD